MPFENFEAVATLDVAAQRELLHKGDPAERVWAAWALDHALPGAFAQAVADAGTSFEGELPGLLGLLGWRFGESDALWPRFGETHFLQLEDPRGMAEVLAAVWARHRLPAGVV
jgi:hypothetical protein